jgi:hypothetical protein
MTTEQRCAAALAYLRRSIGTSAGMHKARIREQAARLREAAQHKEQKE